jgi:sugar/nucleoside kinase (ribokinase family)
VEGERVREGLDELLLLGDYVVTSTDYPKAATGEEDLEAAMVKLAASLPRAKALVTTLGSRGAVMLQRVNEWGEAGGGDGKGEKRETLAGLLAKLEEDAAAAAGAGVGKKSDGGVVVPVPGVPVTSGAVYLTDGGEATAAALGPVRVTFAPAAALSISDVADTTGAGDSFIGSMCYGVATGMDLAAAMRLGAYVAARKCTRLGARPGLPTRDTIPAELLP